MKEKIKIARKRIQEIIDRFPDQKIYVGHSGGKDSSVVLDLALSVKPDIEVIHNGKKIWTEKEPGVTDVHIETLEFLYKYTLDKVERIVFVQTEKMPGYIEKHNLKIQIDGTRIDEFNRTKKSNTFVKNGEDIKRNELTSFNPDGLFGLSFLCPIYDWSSEDVFEYHRIMNVPLSDEYKTDEEYNNYLKNI